MIATRLGLEWLRSVGLIVVGVRLVGRLQRLASEEGCSRLVVRNFGRMSSRKLAAEVGGLCGCGVAAGVGDYSDSGRWTARQLAVWCGSTAETSVRHLGCAWSRSECRVERCCRTLKPTGVRKEDVQLCFWDWRESETWRPKLADYDEAWGRKAMALRIAPAEREITRVE